MKKKPLVAITGASHGIGKATALAFAKEDCSLLLLSRNIEPFPELNSADVLYQKVDVANLSLFKKALEEAEAKFGPLECLVNNAGYMKLGDFKESDASTNNQQIDVLFKGVLNGIRLGLPGMAKRKKGTIINISSIADRYPGPGGVIYHACKAAIRSISSSLQQAEAKNNIRIVNFAPGLVKTNIHKDMGLSFETYAEMLGHPDFIAPEELAEIIVFCWKLPQKICIRDIVVMPTNSAY
jgi:NADP-dependent 3-hydroxy acid dehydrogenase YdfG